jgi:hypothetical protein
MHFTKRLIAFLAFYFLTTGTLRAQKAAVANIATPATGSPAGGATVPPSFDNSLIPPSPEAASLGKFGILPVSLYTGMPQVTIPITEIKTAKLDLPIYLDYNYNGFFC